MERRLFIFAILCLFSCHGLDINLNRKPQRASEGRDLCGVLTCSELVNSSFPSVSKVNQEGFNVVFSSIKSLSVLKQSDTTQGKSDIMLGSVTSQAPRLLRVSNGRKVDGVLGSDRASLRLELVKREDCEAQFTCQVRGFDSHGKELINSASLVRQREDKVDRAYDSGLLPGVMSLQLLTSLQTLVSQTVGDLENIKASMKAREDKIGQQERIFNDRMNYFENRFQDKLSELQNNLGVRIDSFVHRVDGRLDLFENRVENKIDNNNNLNTLMQIDSKVATELLKFRSDAKEDLKNSLDTMRQRLYGEQKDALKNVSETFQNALTNASAFLASSETDLNRLMTVSQVNLLSVKNNTETIRELLASGEVSTQCVLNDRATTSNENEPMPLRCERDMGQESNNSYPHYVLTTQFTLNRQVLCDTQTDGGGWIVMQRRTNRDVFFNRDWESYKTGFGKVDSDGDFWLGNEAVHLLTYVRPYELRVEVTLDGKDFVAVYKTFKLEKESHNYRIRLGTVTSPIDSGSGKAGLFYSNNSAFSCFDRDNDNNSRLNCGLSEKSCWWYNSCYRSKLNAPWTDGKIKDAWYNGVRWMHATRTEMKIRPLK